MIREISLKGVATYNEEIQVNPTEINYMFGSNGSGKTTLANVIYDASDYLNCKVVWDKKESQALVYNKAFIEKNFVQEEDIKGIFTLGENAVDAKKIIEKTSDKLFYSEKKKENLSGQRDNLINKLAESKDNALALCWSVGKRYRDLFKQPCRGVLKNKEDFFKRCLSEYKNNTTSLRKFEELESKYNKIFQVDVKRLHDEYRIIEIDELDRLENEPLLKTKIIGKEDVTFGRLISKLGNSDWVKKGLEFSFKSDGRCPFCQQLFGQEIRENVEAVFDELYEENIEKLNGYRNSYLFRLNDFIEYFKSISNSENILLDFAEFNMKLKVIEEKVGFNQAQIDRKLEKPADEFIIESLKEDFHDLIERVKEYNRIISENNRIVRNIDEEKDILESEVWRLIVEETKELLLNYNNVKNGCEKGISNIDEEILKLNRQIDGFKALIKEKEADSTSILHTKNEINRILKSFGFSNFYLSDADGGYYKIIRQNGEDAKETLSEGEYTFITFLYFYYMVKSNHYQHGLEKSGRVIVIDDPVSSLDSDVLFIVSNLIKDIKGDCTLKRNNIKQLFILTHNVYFFKEVTRLGAREQYKDQESFWLIRNLKGQSNIVKYETNPIKTTYELLWQELKDVNGVNKATIYNTMRRILEYYFNIIGGLNYEAEVNKFQGEEQILFKSLVSWINDGSHYINDDLVVYTELESIEKQLEVFKKIFYALGHDSHYEMMMNRKLV